MIFSWDTYNNLEYPELYLADANKKYIFDGALHVSKLSTELYFNNISQINFSVHSVINNQPMREYKLINVGSLIEVKYIGWFQVSNIEEIGSGNQEEKTITALSLENELCTKRLTSFGQLGYEDDWDGGLDLYCLYSLTDIEHSILHIVTEKCPAWSIGHVDSEIIDNYRSFNVDEINAYSFLTDNVSKAFDCIFIFDTFAQTINAYTLSNYGKKTELYFSDDNLIKEISITRNISDIRTVFYVTGGDDRGTSTLNIIEVNPNGTSYLYDFSYFKQFMSNELQDRLTLYEEEYNNRIDNFTNNVDGLQSLYEELNELKIRMPSAPDSKNWNEYGLNELEVQLDKYNTLLSQYANYASQTNATHLKQKYDEIYNIIYGTTGAYSSSLQYALNKRRKETQSKESEINLQKSICNSSTLNLRDFLGEQLFIELSRYVHEESFNDSSFLATDAMTDDEILEMKKELRDYALKELKKVSQPQYTISVTSLNFASIPRFKELAEQMYLGDLAILELSDGSYIEERMLKFIIDWDTKGFEIIFSNKNSLIDGSMLLQEIQNQAQSNDSTLSIGGFGWNSAKNKKSTFDEYMNNVLDTSLQKIQSSENQEFLIDCTGTKWRKWLYEKNDYSPNQMWGTNNGIYLSSDGFRSVQMAIGEGTFNGEDVYGIWTDLLCGRFVLTKTLFIDNVNSTFTIDNDGLVGTNGINTISITPHKSSIFTITKGNKKQIYFDTDGNAWFNGYVTVGKIVSQNFLDSNGVEGAMINLTDGTFRFANKRLVLDENELSSYDPDIVDNYTKLRGGYLECHGVYEGSWMNIKGSYKTDVLVNDGYITVRNEDTKQDLFFTAQGISTNKDTSYATGVIDFLSQVYGSNYFGITIQTQSSPIGLKSTGSSIILNPKANETSNLFDVTIGSSQQEGRILYGDRTNTRSGIFFGDGTINIVNNTLSDASGNIRCNDINIKSGKLGNSEIATVEKLDLLVSEWKNLLETSMKTSYDKGYNQAKTDFYIPRYQKGYDDGRKAGYDDGYDDGWDEGWSSGWASGYASGASSVTPST